jgi:hypothetical protein
LALALITAAGAGLVPGQAAAHNGRADPPVIVSRPGWLSPQRIATFAFIHDDPGVTLRCRVDGGRERRCASPYTTASLADGPHRFEVVARAATGARSPAAAVRWLVDATPPATPVIMRAPGTATFVFTGTRTSCSLDGAAPEPCSGRVEFGDLEPGAHRFAVTARDLAGNASGAVHEWAVTVAPDVRTGPEGAVRATSADVTGTAPGAVYHFEYGPTTAYGSQTAARAAGAGGAAAATLTGLQPGTSYHYRIVASTCGGCAAGTTRGEDETLTSAPVTTYQNPVYGGLADPMALQVDGTYYAYGTGERFPMARSNDLVHWTTLAPAMATRPAWVPRSGQWNPWAPSVLRLDGPCPGTTSPACFAMYYTGLNTAVVPEVNCLGVAVSTSPAGPFADTGILDTIPSSRDSAGRPIGCGDDGGHSNIDAAPFVDPVTGKGYLYLSTGRDPAHEWRRTISVIPLTADRLHASGPRVPLFSFTELWEHGVVEGPWVKRHGDRYYLFYSGAGYTSDDYALGYAYAGAPDGPFTKAADNPLLATRALVVGPGGGSLVPGPHGGDWLIYHGRAALGAARTARIDPMTIDDSVTPPKVALRGPTTEPVVLP